MRSRVAGLPELELIALDEEEPSPRAQAIEVKSKRWWPVALVGMIVAGAIVATGQGSSVDTADVTVPPLPSTLLRRCLRRCPTARAGPPTLNAVPTPPCSSPPMRPRCSCCQKVARSRSTSPKLPTRSRDTSRDRPPPWSPSPTGSCAPTRACTRRASTSAALAVFPSQDPRRVWLTGVIEGESAVKEMPVDGTVPPQLATGFIALPDNSSVVGVAGRELVLSVRTDLSEPYELVTWDPATRTTEFIARAATLVAAGEGRIAWVRNGCESCGIYVRRDGVMRVVNGISNHDPNVPGTFSQDGRFLALAITGSWPGGGAGAIVHGVTVVDLDPPRRRSWAPCALAGARRHARHPVDCSGRDDLVSGGALLVRDTSDRVVAYEPQAGGIARMFAFRPREAPGRRQRSRRGRRASRTRCRRSTARRRRSPRCSSPDASSPLSASLRSARLALLGNRFFAHPTAHCAAD